MTIKDFTLNEPFITLGQFLKAKSVITSGGQAKWYLRAHPALVNGKGEQRRGKKLYPNDQVKVAGQEYLLRSK